MKYLSRGPVYELFAGGGCVKRGGIQDIPIYYKSLFGWKKLNFVKGIAAYYVSDSFLLTLDPPPKFKVEIRWTLQMIHKKGFKAIKLFSSVGEVLHV